MRTTVDIDQPILNDLKRLQRREGKSLGRLMSELLAEALGRRKSKAAAPPRFDWNVTRGRPLVDLDDKDRLYEILDSEAVQPARR
ncbi:MAG: antitoxin [Deltaproteobacteria bacterium]|nr:antitoxin [Deltaproteobacteria bacterium]